MAGCTRYPPASASGARRWSCCTRPVMVTASGQQPEGRGADRIPDGRADRGGRGPRGGLRGRPSVARPRCSAEWRWKRRFERYQHHHRGNAEPPHRFPATRRARSSSAESAATPREPRPTPARDAAEASPAPPVEPAGDDGPCAE
jgi:hypothetical protein